MELNKEKIDDLAAIIHLDFPDERYEEALVDTPKEYQEKIYDIVKQLYKKMKIIEQHICREKFIFEIIYIKRIIYEKKDGTLDFIKFRVDKKEWLKHFTNN